MFLICSFFFPSTKKYTITKKYCLVFYLPVQVKALLKDRLNGKATGGSNEKSQKTDTSSSVELNSGNFDELVIKSKELWIVEFFAPW